MSSACVLERLLWSCMEDVLKVFVAAVIIFLKTSFNSWAGLVCGERNSERGSLSSLPMLSSSFGHQWQHWVDLGLLGAKWQIRRNSLFPAQIFLLDSRSFYPTVYCISWGGYFTSISNVTHPDLNSVPSFPKLTSCLDSLLLTVNAPYTTKFLDPQIWGCLLNSSLLSPCTLTLVLITLQYS